MAGRAYGLAGQARAQAGADRALTLQGRSVVARHVIRCAGSGAEISAALGGDRNGPSMTSRLRRLADRGFTLIELLIVILIVGILAAIALPSFLNQTNKAKDTAVKTSLTVALKNVRAGAKTNDDSYDTSPAGVTKELKELATGEPQYTVRPYRENGDTTYGYGTAQVDAGWTVAGNRSTPGTSSGPNDISVWYDSPTQVTLCARSDSGVFFCLRNRINGGLSTAALPDTHASRFGPAAAQAAANATTSTSTGTTELIARRAMATTSSGEQTITDPDGNIGRGDWNKPVNATATASQSPGSGGDTTQPPVVTPPPGPIEVAISVVPPAAPDAQQMQLSAITYAGGHAMITTASGKDAVLYERDGQTSTSTVLASYPNNNTGSRWSGVNPVLFASDGNPAGDYASAWIAAANSSDLGMGLEIAVRPAGQPVKLTHLVLSNDANHKAYWHDYAQPQVVVDAVGRVHVAYLLFDPSVGVAERYQVHVATSTDGGQNWTDTAVAQGNNTGGDHNIAMDVTPTGSIYLATSKTVGSVTRGTLNIYTSTPDGMSWVLDKSYGSLPNSGTGQLRMAIGAEGTIALIDDRLGGVYMLVKRPSGSWPAGALTAQDMGVTAGNTIGGIPFDTISVAVGGEGSVFAMFKRDGSNVVTNPQRRWIARLKPGSSTWQTRRYDYTNLLVQHPIAVIADANGNAVFAEQRSRNGSSITDVFAWGWLAADTDPGAEKTVLTGAAYSLTRSGIAAADPAGNAMIMFAKDNTSYKGYDWYIGAGSGN